MNRLIKQLTDMGFPVSSAQAAHCALAFSLYFCLWLFQTVATPQSSVSRLGSSSELHLNPYCDFRNLL